MAENIFVYGTLRSGEANDITQVARRYGIALPEYAGRASVTSYLHDFGNFPGLALDGRGVNVVGEIYRIAPQLLPILDEIEEFRPGRPSLFERVETSISLGDQALTCHVYLIAGEEFRKHPLIGGGDWVAYRKGRSNP